MIMQKPYEIYRFITGINFHLIDNGHLRGPMYSGEVEEKDNFYSKTFNYIKIIIGTETCLHWPLMRYLRDGKETVWIPKLDY